MLLEQVTLALSVVALVCSGSVVVLWLRSTPRRLTAAQEDLGGEMTALKARFVELVGLVEATEKRVESNLEAIEEERDRIDRKRARAERADQRSRARDEQQQQPVDELEQARQRARGMGFNV